MSNNAGGSAFPQTMVDLGGEAGLVSSDDLDGQGGMTLRDYFAAKSILAAMAQDGMEQDKKGFNYSAVAAMSYRMADAMLAERDK